MLVGGSKMGRPRELQVLLAVWRSSHGGEATHVSKGLNCNPGLQPMQGFQIPHGAAIVEARSMVGGECGEGLLDPG